MTTKSLSKKLYPTCSSTFNMWINTNPNPHISNIYAQMNKPRLFDVSLRDGLQSIGLAEQKNFSTEAKLRLYDTILSKYNPTGIEVGSLVSPKVLPILADSVEMYKQTSQLNDLNYLLVPSMSRLKEAIGLGCNNISLISSVSESFQKKNTKKTLSETKTELLEMMYEYYSTCKIKNPKVKLYLSCIDHCPIEGQIPLDKIKEEIEFYNQICKPDIICLSDTCGTLNHDNFVKLVKDINLIGINSNKLSLHLHIDLENMVNAQKIFFSALDNGILEFDVSLLESGGCSVTMGASKTKPNLSYELYYKFLSDYIMYKLNKL